MTPVLLLICAIVAPQAFAFPMHDRVPSLFFANNLFETKPFSMCQAFGFDNDLACLYCSHEELAPFLHVDSEESVSSSMIASSASCLQNMCESCGSDAACLIVNGKSLAPYCDAAMSMLPDTLSLRGEELVDQAASSAAGSGLEANFEASSGSGDDSFIVVIFFSFYRFVFVEPILYSDEASYLSGSGVGSDAVNEALLVPASGYSGSGIIPDFSLSDAQPVTTGAPTTTTASTTSFTMTPPVSQPAPGTVQLFQNITLGGVFPSKFKMIYLVSAISQTLNVPVSSIYAQIDDVVVLTMEPHPTSMSFSFIVVTSQDDSFVVLNIMSNITNSDLAVNLQAQSSMFANVTITASPVLVANGASLQYCILLLAGVGLAAVFAVFFIGYFLIMSCKRTRVTRVVSYPQDEKAYKYEILPTFESDIAPSAIKVDDSSDDEILA